MSSRTRTYRGKLPGVPARVDVTTKSGRTVKIKISGPLIDYSKAVPPPAKGGKTK